METIKRRGAFAQYSDGTWGIDTKVKIDGSFSHFKKKGYATLGAAKADFERAKAEFISSKGLNKMSVTLFDDLLAEYAKMRSNTVNQSTAWADKSIYKVDFMPTFGKKLIKDCFTQSAMDDWYNSMVGDVRLSDNKKSKAVARMKDLLKFAYQRKFIDAVTYQDCDVILYPIKSRKAAQTERVVWSTDEERRFMDCITDRRDYVMFSVFLSCGARLGEFLALQPKHFDRAKRKIKICQQALTLPGQGTFVTDKLKTHDSYRTVMLSQDVSDMLAEYIDSIGIADEEFIFFELDRSKPMGRSTFRRRLYKYCDIAGVRKINPHASRHIQATRLASVCVTGQEIEAAARRLGHSPEMFLNTYARHASDETETELIKRLPKA